MRHEGRPNAGGVSTVVPSDECLFRKNRSRRWIVCEASMSKHPEGAILQYMRMPANGRDLRGCIDSSVCASKNAEPRLGSQPHGA